MTLIPEVIPKLPTPKNMVTSMSKKSRFKGFFVKQHGKRAQTLLKFAWEHLYHLYWLLWMQLTCKKSLLVTCKISRLFPNTLSADEKYSVLNRENLTQPIQMEVSRKQKTFSEFIFGILKSNLNFEHFQKKGWLSYLRYFRDYGLRKTWLHQCLKSHVSTDLSERNTVNAGNHCWNLHGTTFTIFTNNCECNWLAKSLC